MKVLLMACADGAAPLRAAEDKHSEQRNNIRALSERTQKSPTGPSFKRALERSRARRPGFL